MSLTAPATLAADLAPAAGDVDARAVVTLRLLAADAVERANSGHPGLPMGTATAMWTLWSRFLRHDPADPTWPDRDRFVLSAGHGSMLLYGLLHLFGYDLPLEELRRFRQWGSATPGHPEYGHTAGVETTTGPLGQGLTNAVGMALAERMLAARCNRDGHEVVSHRTWVLASDGDLMEGISHEAASLAGHLGLGRLVVCYDDNRITIDGPTDLSLSDDAATRFRGYGWHTHVVDDAEDREAVAAALAAAAAEEDRPSLVLLRTTIGYGAPTKSGTSGVHGAPLGGDELARTKARFGWPPEQSFLVPDDVRERCAALAARGAATHREWRERRDGWAAAHPELAQEWERTHARRLPDGWQDNLPAFDEGASLATRQASGKSLAALAKAVPELVGGSADLAGSTGTALPDGDVVRGGYEGRTIHFGVREHAMGAVLNGLALHGGFRPFGSTFLVFSDYLRPALRLSALMRLPVIYIFTHDSIGVGEDGPTHQPVEHVAALRTVPGLAVLRPGDANETAHCWAVALARTDGPTALVLSRQGLPVLPSPPEGAVGAAGAWAVRDPEDPDVILVATGSEVRLAVGAAERLEAEGVAARVVSMPWRERFLALAPAERARLVPPGVPCVVVEAGVTQGWEAVAGLEGQFVTLTRFGASAPGPEVMERLGFTVERVIEAAQRAIAMPQGGALRC